MAKNSFFSKLFGQTLFQQFFIQNFWYIFVVLKLSHIHVLFLISAFHFLGHKSHFSKNGYVPENCFLGKNFQIRYFCFKIRFESCIVISVLLIFLKNRGWNLCWRTRWSPGHFQARRASPWPSCSSFSIPSGGCHYCCNGFIWRDSLLYLMMSFGFSSVGRFFFYDFEGHLCLPVQWDDPELSFWYVWIHLLLWKRLYWLQSDRYKMQQLHNM